MTTVQPRTGLVALKMGMTRLFNDAGDQVPVTILKVDECRVISHRTVETNGYTALQLGFGMTAGNGIGDGPRQYCIRFSRMNETPIAVISGARRGALRSRR